MYIDTSEVKIENAEKIPPQNGIQVNTSKVKTENTK